MWLLIVEALIALAILVSIVWWTMSSRRKPPAHDSEDRTETRSPDPTQAASPARQNENAKTQAPDKKA